MANLLYNFMDPKEKRKEAGKSSAKNNKTMGHFENRMIEIPKEAMDSPNRGLSPEDISHDVGDEPATQREGRKTEENSIFHGLKMYFGRVVKIKFKWRRVDFDFLSKKLGYEKYLYLERKAFKRINRDLDIVELLKKNKEVNKIKDFLFDDEQRTIFEFLPKPLIKTGGEAPRMLIINSPRKSTKKSFTKRHPSEFMKSFVLKRGKDFDDEISIYFELYKTFLNLSSSEKANDSTNKKLINLLGDSLLEVFTNGCPEKSKK